MPKPAKHLKLEDAERGIYIDSVDWFIEAAGWGSVAELRSLAEDEVR